MNDPMNSKPTSETAGQYAARLRGELTIGDVVTLGFMITKQRWNKSLRLILQGFGWLLLPVFSGGFLLAFMPAMMPLSSRATRSVPPGSVGLMVLFSVVWLVCFLYCFGRYLSIAGLVSRLAFNDLADHEESLQDSKRFTASRTWSYLLSAFLCSLLFGLMLIVVGIGVFIILMILGAIAMGLGIETSRAGASLPMIIVTLIALLVMFVMVTGLLWWFGSRFLFYEVPLSVEREVGAVATIGRTWSLGNGANWRLMMITSVAFLVTVPVQVMAQFVGSIPVFLLRSAGDAVPIALFFATALNLVVSLVTSMLAVSFWQTIKAVAYFDLRNRREGEGLILR